MKDMIFEEVALFKLLQNATVSESSFLEYILEIVCFN